MRLLRAIALMVLIAATPAAAAPRNPTLTISMESTYAPEGSIQPTVTLAGGTDDITGSLEFRRYNEPSCNGGYQNLGAIGVFRNRDYTGLNVQNGMVGDYGLRVFFNSSNESVNSDRLSDCVTYLVQRKVGVDAVLTKSVYSGDERIEPQLSLTGANPDTGGSVTLERFGGSGCKGNGSSAGQRPVAGGKVDGTLDLRDGILGSRSMRAVYSGDAKYAGGSSACRDFTVGVFVRGRVFADLDGNGVIDSGEVGIADVVVTLRRGDVVAATTTTSINGSYEFLVTATGAYLVVQAQPLGFNSTTPDELSLLVTSAGAASGYNFGEAPPPSTLLPSLSAPAGPTGEFTSDTSLTSSSRFAGLRLLALGLVVIAALIMLFVIFKARRSREDL